MSTTGDEPLLAKHCTPCEGGVPALARDSAESLAQRLQDWVVAADARSISRSWNVKDFMEAIDFFNRVAALAEAEGHHPDLHLEGYRRVKISLTTHAVGGLTENDFIMAAKISQLPVRLKGQVAKP